MAKRIGIIGAMSVEVEQLKAGMQDKKEEIQGGLTFIQGKLNGIDAVVVQSGVGKVNAALCAQRLILQFGVSHIINTDNLVFICTKTSQTLKHTATIPSVAPYGNLCHNIAVPFEYV